MTGTYNNLYQEFIAALETKNLADWVENAHNSGKLKDFLPEVDKLWSIPERTDFHPEGNSGAHTLLVLQAGRDLPAKAKFALLLHDIGKTTTPKEKWPRHFSHDINGLPLVEQICIRLGVSKEYTDFAKLVCEHHMKGHLFSSMKIAKLYDLSEKFTNDDFDLFIKCCRADTQGRAISKEKIVEAAAVFNIGANRFKTLRERFTFYKEQGMNRAATLNKMGHINI